MTNGELGWGCRSALVVMLLLGLAPSWVAAIPQTESSAQEVSPSQERHHRVIAALSGPSAGMEGLAGPARSTPEERARTADFLVTVFEELGLQPKRHRYSFRNQNPIVDFLLSPFRGTNVYAILQPSEPSEDYVIVGAHYDSETQSPGAGDNAAGVALVASLAEQLQKQPRRVNFVFVFFDQEEDDEVGSRAFVRLVEDLGWRVRSVHITDVVAWDEDGDGTVEVQLSADGPLERLYRSTAARLGISLKVVGGRGASDNKSFAEAGFATAGVWSEEITPHMHRTTDTIETVDFEFLATAERLLIDVLGTLADPADRGDPRGTGR